MKIKSIAKNWWLVDSGPGAAALNMATDERLLSLAPRLPVDGILRFYWFDPPAVTLGFFQKPTSINQDDCLTDGVPVVRRLTGGRAVFHHKELTYSLVLPVTNPYFDQGVTASFLGIAQALQGGLETLGIKTELEKSRGSRGSNEEAACFRSSGRYEIKVNGRKLLGSAQVRRDGYLLQHGSVYLRYFPQQANKYLNNKKSNGMKIVGSPVADLYTLLGKTVSRDTVKRALAAGFSQKWGVNFIRSITNSSRQDYKSPNTAKESLVRQGEVC